jgi:hypothetical protein
VSGGTPKLLRNGQRSRREPDHSLPSSAEVKNCRVILPLPTASVVKWSEFLATDPEVRVRFPVLPDFLRSSGSGTGPLSLVSTIEQLLERKSSGSGLENRDYGRR